MRRRQFIALLGGAAAAWPLAAWGQQQPAKLAPLGRLVSHAAGLSFYVVELSCQPCYRWHYDQ